MPPASFWTQPYARPANQSLPQMLTRVHLRIFNTYSLCGLFCNYKWALERTKPVYSNSVMLTCDFVQAQPSMACEQFRLTNTRYKARVNLFGLQQLLKGAACQDHLPRMITSRSQLPDKSTIGKIWTWVTQTYTVDLIYLWNILLCSGLPVLYRWLKFFRN